MTAKNLANILARALGLVVALQVGPSAALAQSLQPPYNADYTLTHLGAIRGVPASYGGLVFRAGDPNTLLIGGSANNGAGAIYQIGVVRDGTNHVTGFAGAATLFATAPNIDGGLAYGPGGVLLFTAYPSGALGEIRPGSTAPDKTVQLGQLGYGTAFANSVGSLIVTPGSTKILVYNQSWWYSSQLIPDGSGTYNVAPAASHIQLSGGIEGGFFVPSGSPDFPSPSLLVTEFRSSQIGAYDVDANSDPLSSSRRTFVTALNGAVGGVVDPLTADFLFSTFAGTEDIIRVSGFMPSTPPPPPTTCPPDCPPPSATPELDSIALFGIGAAGVIGYLKLRRRARG